MFGPYSRIAASKAAMSSRSEALTTAGDPFGSFLTTVLFTPLRELGPTQNLGRGTVKGVPRCKAHAVEVGNDNSVGLE